MLVIAGTDPWQRYHDLRPHDRVLSAVTHIEQVFILDRLRKDEIVKTVRVLCRTVPDVAWPLMGRGAPNVGVLDRQGIVTVAENMHKLGQRIGICHRDLRSAWLGGVVFKGYQPVAAHAVDRPPEI